jgi:phage pi2 protein 07
VLLNLAFIPDDVIYKLQDFDHGWSFKFKEFMEEYINEKFQDWAIKLKEIEYSLKQKYGCGQYHGSLLLDIN